MCGSTISYAVKSVKYVYLNVDIVSKYLLFNYMFSFSNYNVSKAIFIFSDTRRVAAHRTQ